jgi:FMN phosphatase YigB (HAD superfamily)
VDETGMWMRIAHAAGVTPLTLMAGLGATIALGRQHDDVWELLGIEYPEGAWSLGDPYPDALPCLARLRDAGLRVYACGNMPAFVEDEFRPYVDGTGSAEAWDLWKPDPAFFERLIELTGAPRERIAYVGDRVDNDVAPALAAGMVGVHIRRGPWGYLQQPPAGAIRVGTLDELPGAFA